MARCNCGGKIINSKKPAAKKVAPKKVAPKKADASQLSARSKRLSAAATKKALAKPNPYAKGCKCSK